MKTQIIIPPKDGWKNRSVYQVEVCYGPNNPVHGALFYTGFVSKAGIPAGYNEILTTEDYTNLQDVYFMRAIKLMCNDPEKIKTSNKGKTHTDVGIKFDITPLC